MSLGEPLHIGDASEPQTSVVLAFSSLICPLVDSSRVILSAFSSYIISIDSSLVLTGSCTGSFSS